MKKDIVFDCKKMLSSLQADDKDLLENIPNLAETLKLGIPDKKICKALNSVQNVFKVTPYKLKKFREKHGIVLEKDGAVLNQCSEKAETATNKAKEDLNQGSTKPDQQNDGIVESRLFTSDEDA